jgi:transcriptional regulator with XRE-family HTH domain
MTDQARRQRAVELRLAGHSRAEIAHALGVKTGGQALSRWLQGVAPAEWTARPNAKDDLRERAVALRLDGRSYREITELLGVSKSTLSSWLCDVPLTAEQREALAGRQRDAIERRAESVRAARVAKQERIKSQARAQVSALSDRELFVAGVVAYWAEGAKDKPWRRSERVRFMNSDPDLIRLFLRWLELIGIERDRLTWRVNIHESADAAAAVRYWSEAVRVPTERFAPVTLKRHNPRTNRNNLADGYHGCLQVTVRRSTDLYRQIEGWWAGIAGREARNAQLR